MSTTVTQILSSDDIFSSLADINSVYLNFDTQLNNIQKIVDDQYQYIIDFYNENFQQLQESITLAQTLSSDWDSFQTTVSENSAKWLQPLTLIYPKINNYPFYESNLNEITNWLNSKFPVIDTNTNELLFVENQKAIISCYMKHVYPKLSLNQYVFQPNTSQTLCSTSNPNVCVSCQTTYGGLVGCHQGLFNCQNTTYCTFCAPTHCSYKNPPYIIIDSLHAYSRIEAYVKVSYQEISEDENIITIVFTVKNCQWIFNNYITS